MKALFKNKKFIIASVLSVSIILTSAVLIPTVFSKNNGKDKSLTNTATEKALSQGGVTSLTKTSVNDDASLETTPAAEPESAPEVVPQAEPEIAPEAAPEVEPEVAQPEVTPEAEPESTPEVVPETEPESTPEIAPEAEPEVAQPAAEELIKFENNAFIVENLKFNYKSTDEEDSLFGTTTKRYLTDTFDSIVVDSEDNTIYKLYLSDKTVLSENFKAASNSEYDLKLMADKIATCLGADIKRYDVCNMKFDETYEKYYVTYKLTINGYSTSEHTSVAFDKDLNFCSYYCMPNVFDGIDVSNLVIDENAIKEEINKETTALRGESFDNNEIIDMTLTVKDSKVIMVVECGKYSTSATHFIPNCILVKHIEIK